MLFGAGVLSVIFGRPYLEGLGKSAQGAPNARDPRAQQYLKEGEAALDEGNLDQAKESFDKASVLAEGDPRVLLDLARLATARADVPWLRQRILPGDSPALNTVKRELDDLAPRARKASAAALAAAPEDTAAKRVEVDALRIVGEGAAARALVGALSANAAQADTAYVLGMLDLAELDPPWTIVIERLRAASSGESVAGRARAALVYAMARSGDAPGARRELERLMALPRPHPLGEALKAYVDRVEAEGGTVANRRRGPRAGHHARRGRGGSRSCGRRRSGRAVAPRRAEASPWAIQSR